MFLLSTANAWSALAPPRWAPLDGLGNRRASRARRRVGAEASRDALEAVGDAPKRHHVVPPNWLRRFLITEGAVRLLCHENINSDILIIFMKIVVQSRANTYY